MRIRIALIMLFTLFFSSMPLPASAEEDLFDTEAAATYREQGLAALRHKNFDAAIDAFEEAIAASPDADSYYLLGYAYYLKGKKTGDEESRMKASENFSQAYQINPNFTPSKFKPEELVAPPAGQAEGLGAAAPASKRETPPAAQPKSAPTGTPAAAPQPASAPTATPANP